MIDSHITENITTDCHQQSEKPAAIEGHQAGCVCDRCSQLSKANCEDNPDQCPEAQQTSGGMKTMRTKQMPMLANCAGLLVILVISGVIAQARHICGAEAIDINLALETQLAEVISSDEHINGLGIAYAGPIVIDHRVDSVGLEAIDTGILEGNDVAIPSLNHLDQPVDLDILRDDLVEEHSLTVDGINEHSPSVIVDHHIRAIASVDGDIAQTIVG